MKNSSIYTVFLGLFKVIINAQINPRVNPL
jgi:hypothetical protein